MLKSVSNPILVEILKSSPGGYALDLLTEDEIDSLEIFDKKGKPYLYCLASDKERSAKPEEIVRQLYIQRLIKEYRYPKDRIAVDKGVYFGSAMAEKRADIFISDPNDPDTSYIIVECKKPKRRPGATQNMPNLPKTPVSTADFATN